MARDFIGGAIILDADQMIYNENVLKKTFKLSGYNCVWMERETKEWMLTEKNGMVTHCNKEGGKGGWQLYSISRWTVEDGERLKEHIETEFEERKNTQIYWDDIALFCYPEAYRLGICEMKTGDVVEIDDIKELAVIDKYYERFL